MKAPKSNLFVGSTVLFDFPVRTKQVSEPFRARALEEVKSSPLWGLTGLVMGVSEHDGIFRLKVRLLDGQVIEAHLNDVSITELPKDRTEETLERISCQLGELLTTLTQIKR